MIRELLVVAVLVTVYALFSWWILRDHPVPSRGRHRANSCQWVDVTPIVQLVTEFELWRAASTQVRRRSAAYESWMERRAVEAPFFARLAAEMGLGYALGVAA